MFLDFPAVRTKYNIIFNNLHLFLNIVKSSRLTTLIKSNKTLLLMQHNRMMAFCSSVTNKRISQHMSSTDHLHLHKTSYCTALQITYSASQTIQVQQRSLATNYSTYANILYLNYLQKQRFKIRIQHTTMPHKAIKHNISLTHSSNAS